MSSASPRAWRSASPATRWSCGCDSRATSQWRLRSAEGEHLGHLGVLTTGPLSPDEEKLAALRIFAARAAAELERRRAECALREREAAHRSLAEEQAALRRVATLVAAGAPEQDVLDRVVGEAGPLLDADVASLVRADGAHGEIVAGWSRAGRTASAGRARVRARKHAAHEPGAARRATSPGR